MKVAHFVGPNLPLQVVDVSTPHLEPDEILVTIHTAAICGSDIHTWTGNRPEVIPSVLGHEGIGAVIESRREGTEVRDLVTWSLVDSCGTCPYCTGYKIPQKCSSLWKYGHGGAELDGTYATHMKIRAGTTVFQVPDGLDLNLATTANCALATAVNAVMDLPRQGRAVVLGSGLVGLYSAFLLKREGFETSIIEIQPQRALVAQSLGFEVFSSIEGKVDLLIEAAGVPEALHASYQSVRTGGEIRLVGLVHPNSALNLTAEDLIRRCWTLRGYHNYSPEGLCIALETAKDFQKLFPAGFSIGPTYPLEQINEAIARSQTKLDLRVFVTP